MTKKEQARAVEAMRLAIDAAGGGAALARALGVSAPAVSQWQRVPVRHCHDIERMTGVVKEELRPDVFK